MAANDYHFITTWYVPGTSLEELYVLLGNGPDLVRWWPSVYLDATELDAGDPETGLGKVIDLYTKGWLPYTLRWKFTVTEVRPYQGYTLQAEGDFVGRGIWTFEEAGKTVRVIYDWKIRAVKPLLRNFSFLLKPVFSVNHHWAMELGETSLLLELARRHASSPAEAARIPPPPGPTFMRRKRTP